MAVSQSLYLTQQSQDALRNTSTVRILWQSTQTGGSYNLLERTAYYYVSVNGGPEFKYAVKYTLPVRTTQTIVDTLLTVVHNDEGECSISVRTYMDTKISAGEISLSKDLELTQIARASTIGAADADIGSVSSVIVTRRSNAYTHSVQYRFGDLQGYVLADGSVSDTEVKLTATSIPFKVPETFYSQIPNDPSARCVLTCRTYAEAAQVGNEHTATFVARANVGLCAPSVQGYVEDVNSTTIELTGDSRRLVRYRSTAKCSIVAAAKNGAELVQTQINGKDTPDNVLYLDRVEVDQVTFKAVDSRGYYTTQGQAVKLVKYVELTANTKLTRIDPTSGRARLAISGNFFNQSFGAVQNQLTVSYRIAQKGFSFSGDFQDLAPEITENAYNVTVDVSGLDYENAYTAQVIVSDKVTTLERQTTVNRGIPVFDWGERDFRFNVPILLSPDSYGATYPKNPKTGQVFFLKNNEQGYTITVYDGSNWT